MIRRLLRRLDQGVHRHLRRRDVGVAEAEVDHVDPGLPGFRLETVHLGEGVRGQRADPAEVHR
jgi:hypothetical protein